MTPSKSSVFASPLNKVTKVNYWINLEKEGNSKSEPSWLQRRASHTTPEEVWNVPNSMCVVFKRIQPCNFKNHLISIRKQQSSSDSIPRLLFYFTLFCVNFATIYSSPPPPVLQHLKQGLLFQSWRTAWEAHSSRTFKGSNEKGAFWEHQFHKNTPVPSQTVYTHRVKGKQCFHSAAQYTPI